MMGKFLQMIGYLGDCCEFFLFPLTLFCWKKMKANVRNVCRAVHFIMIVSGAIDCCWMAQYGRKRSSRHGSSRSRSSRSETVTRVRVTRTAV